MLVAIIVDSPIVARLTMIAATYIDLEPAPLAVSNKVLTLQLI